MNAAKPLGAGHEVTITRVFKAPPALVFDCFTDRAHFAEWWGPADCESAIHKFEPRPGGEISLTMSGPGFSHTMGGEFVEIDPPRRLVFLTMAFEAPDGGWGIVNRITVTLRDLGGTTEVVTYVLVEKAAGDVVLGALGGMEEGWSQSLKRLGDLAARLAAESR